jgi:hypothetical protein
MFGGLTISKEREIERRERERKRKERLRQKSVLSGHYTEAKARKARKKHRRTQRQ